MSDLLDRAHAQQANMKVEDAAIVCELRTRVMRLEILSRRVLAAWDAALLAGTWDLNFEIYKLRELLEIGTTGETKDE